MLFIMHFKPIKYNLPYKFKENAYTVVIFDILVLNEQFRKNF